MQSKQYRVWDAEQHVYIDEIFLGPDGLLYAQNYDDIELLVPGSISNEWQESHRAYEQQVLDIREHQHEWYTVEFATGYPDKNGTMIFEGDIVSFPDTEKHPHYGTGETVETAYFPVTWGYFDDCCVEGETWILGEFEQPTVYTHHDNVIIVGTIHTIPELLEKKKEEKS